MFNLTYLSKKAAIQKQLSFISPAKINLFFRVLCKRADEFHEIASLYQAISLHDTISISHSEEDVFTCSDPMLLMDDKNLVCKALKLFRQKTGICDQLRIHLEKRIPIEAGLGGGSSNAATALWAFFQMFSLEISREELASLGSLLGSDVPFFFSSGTAYCTGRGEKLTEVILSDFLRSSSIWIAKPSKGLSTRLVYSKVNPSQLSIRDPQESLSSFIKGKTPLFYNDLEESAFFLYPDLEKIKRDLLDLGFDQVVMSGSGTSFFCIGTLDDLVLEGVEFFSINLIQKLNLRWYAL